MGNNDGSSDFWGAALSVYRRADALADGVLIDVTDAARAAGLRLPTAMTCAAYAALGADELAQRVAVLSLVRLGARTAGDSDRITFRVRGAGRAWVDAWALVGPGDDPAPVLTVMLVGED
jgi:hypothetical protein